MIINKYRKNNNVWDVTEVENVQYAMERACKRIGSVQDRNRKDVVAVMELVRVARVVDEGTPINKYSFFAYCVCYSYLSISS
jgi:hypothetical protein